MLSLLWRSPVCRDHKLLSILRTLLKNYHVVKEISSCISRTKCSHDSFLLETFLLSLLEEGSSVLWGPNAGKLRKLVYMSIFAYWVRVSISNDESEELDSHGYATYANRFMHYLPNLQNSWRERSFWKSKINDEINQSNHIIIFTL